MSYSPQTQYKCGKDFFLCFSRHPFFPSALIVYIALLFVGFDFPFINSYTHTCSDNNFCLFIKRHTRHHRIWKNDDDFAWKSTLNSSAPRRIFCIADCHRHSSIADFVFFICMIRTHTIIVLILIVLMLIYGWWWIQIQIILSRILALRYERLLHFV